MINDLFERLEGQLIVSCQDYVEVMIPAAVRSGAAALRINGPQDVRLARAKTSLPILACNKIYFPNSPVYITPSVRTARSLILAGADMIAFDARAVPRPRESVAELLSAIHDADRIAVADVATSDEGIEAHRLGADVVATTFAPEFSPALVQQLNQAGCRVLAEGQIDSPEKIACAVEAGAWAACVGTAITRPHLIASQFSLALRA